MQQQTANGSKQSRKGDTSRSSSQGRKLSSGSKPGNKKETSEINDDTRNPVREEHESKKRKPSL